MTRVLHLFAGTVAAAAIVNPGATVNGLHKSHAPTSGTIQLDRTASGHTGNATLEYEGRPHRVSISIGGLSNAQMEARFSSGYVYHLSHLSHFSGAYGPLRHNAASLSHKSGVMWLQNGNGVVIGLQNRHGHTAPMHVRAARIAFTP